jgi:CheY-like chemotaxis protein
MEHRAPARQEQNGRSQRERTACPPIVHLTQALALRVAAQLSGGSATSVLLRCGLLVQLKGNEATAPVKVILLADGGPLERSHALDLGADDVLSIPFEPVELFARIRAQLREKAPDDRLRSEPKRRWRPSSRKKTAARNVGSYWGW